MMMVENVPFMHHIADIVTDNLGMGDEAFATVLAAFAVSSCVVGIFFYLLGIFKVGSAVYFFPRHVITGCIGKERPPSQYSLTRYRQVALVSSYS
jgi:SulP family sulfate permease